MTTLEDAFREGARWREAQNHNGIVSDRYLLSRNPYVGVQQPSPSAEPDEWVGQQRQWAEDAMRAPQPVEPPSIPDMAPGTTFTANEGNRYMRTAPDVLGRPGDAVDVVGWFYQAHQFDPSTIRDVTPPLATGA